MFLKTRYGQNTEGKFLHTPFKSCVLKFLMSLLNVNTEGFAKVMVKLKSIKLLKSKNVKYQYWYKSPLDKSNSKLQCTYMVHVQSRMLTSLYFSEFRRMKYV